MKNSKKNIKLWTYTFFVYLGISLSCLEAFAECRDVFDCVLKNEEENLEKVLKAGANANAFNPGGATPLSLAAYYGRKNLCAVLVRFGADVNLKTKSGSTPLIESVTFVNSPETTLFLLRAGANINDTSALPETALMMAAKKGFAGAVDELLKFNPNLNFRNEAGNHALNYALTNGHDAVGVKLVKAGSDLRTKNSAQNFPLIYAAHYGLIESVRALLAEKVNVDEQGESGRTALYDASMNGHREVVNALLFDKANPNIVTTDAWSPLMVSSSRGYHEIVVSLISAKAQINQQSVTEKLTPLMLAVRNGHLNIVYRLLDEAPILSLQDRGGMTALMYSTVSKSESILNALLSKNPNPNVKDANLRIALHHAIIADWLYGVEKLAAVSDLSLEDKSKSTPLILAVLNARINLMEVLLAAGANINQFNSVRETALCQAVRSARPAAVNLLLDKKADVNLQCSDGRAALSLSAQNSSNFEIFRAIVEKNPDLESKDHQGMTALLVACTNRNLPALELLLQKNANPNAIEAQGNFPLKIAVQDDREDIVRMLLRYRADPNQKDKYDNSIQFNLISSNQVQKFKYLEILHLAGADINLRNNNGITILILAVKRRNQAAFDWVLSKSPNLNLSETDGLTALTAAIDDRNLVFVTRLLQAGADVNLKDARGVAPLTEASRLSDQQFMILLLDRGAKLRLQVGWQNYSSQPDQLIWKVANLTKEILPYKYSTGLSSIRLDMTSDPSLYNLASQIKIKNLYNDKSFELAQDISFDEHGVGWLSVTTSQLYPATEFAVNKNLYYATWSAQIGQHQFTASSEKLLHIFKSEAILFLPGILGSEIYLDIGGQRQLVFPNIYHPYTFSELACNAAGVPLKPALWLDLLKVANIPGPDGATDQNLVYDRILGREDVLNPQGFYKLYAFPKNNPNPPDPESYRVPYFDVIAWPYDWRLHLEKAVDVLLAPLKPGDNDPIYPPYVNPVSIRHIVATLKKTKNYSRFIDDKVSLIGHSTGGLIARGVVKKPVARQLVNKTFFVNVPFYGAPKAYYVYASGDMGVLIVPNSEMRAIAPNAPIVYYLSPSASYSGGIFPDSQYRRSDFTVAAPYVTPYINQAIQLGHYPANLPPWNNALDLAAHNYMQSILGEPVIGWANTYAFYSDTKLYKTVGQIELTLTGIKTYGTDGDNTVPLESQKADFPASQLIEILSRPEHARAPNEDQVWRDILRLL